MQMSVSVFLRRRNSKPQKKYMSQSEGLTESESVFSTDNEEDDFIQQARELSRGPSCLSGMLEISQSTETSPLEIRDEHMRIDHSISLQQLVENERRMKITIATLLEQNDILNRDLRGVTGERDDLIEDNRRIIEEKQKVSEERDLYGHQQNELIERNSRYREEKRALKHQNRQYESELQAITRETNQNLQQFNEKHADLKALIKQQNDLISRLRIANLSDKCQHCNLEFGTGHSRHSFRDCEHVIGESCIYKSNKCPLCQ